MKKGQTSKKKAHWIVQSLDSGRTIWIDFSVGNFKWEAINDYETEYGHCYDEDRKNGKVRCIKVFEK